jgi:tetratricopeptide (TPR) repeat protein
MSFRNASCVTATLAVLILGLVFVPILRAQNKEVPLTGSKEAVALFIQGREKVENLEDPGTLFDQAIAKDPNFAMAYLFAGRSNPEFQKNLAKAVSLADKVSPGEKEWILAAKAQSDGNLPERKAHLDKLVQLYPNDPRVHEQMGYYYRSIGDNATALTHFQDASRLDKKYAPAYNDIGYANMGLDKYADAETAFKNYITLIPKNPNPYDSYAEMLMKTGRYDDSIAQYNKALATDPAFFNSYRGLGNNYVYKGDYTKAREAYQKMYDKAPDDAGRDLALASLMNSYVAEGQIDKAMEVDARRIELNQKAGDLPAQIGIYMNAGFVLLEAGKVDDAAKQFEMADKLRADPSLPAAYRENQRFGTMIGSARLLIARGQFDQARAKLEETKQFLATRNNPNMDRTYNQVAGLLELKQKNYAKAIDYLSKANPNDPYTAYYTATAYEGSGDTKKAADLYGKVANWNQLDDTGHSIVRSRAVVKGNEMAKVPPKK